MTDKQQNQLKTDSLIDDQHTQFNNKDTQNYPSGDLILSVIQKEYDYESARKTTIETRSGLLITLILGIVSFLVTNIKIPQIEQPIDSNSILFYFFSLYTLLVCIGLSFCVSLIFLLKVFMTAEYNRLDIEGLKEEYGIYPRDAMAMIFMEKYRDIIVHNHKMNTKKTNNYNIGIYALIILILLSIALYFFIK